MKRFCCRDVIPGCDHVFTGVDDDSVLDQVIAHAAADHGLVEPPAALAELVVASTFSVPTSRSRHHLRLVDGGDTADDARTHAEPIEPQMQHPASSGGSTQGHRTAAVLAFPRARQPMEAASTAQAPHWHAETALHDRYRHECFLYRGTDDFVDALVPFIRDGLELDQPVMVAVIEPRASALRTALGSDAEAVVFVDMALLGANPARIIPAWQAFADDAGGRPIRGVGEPIWAGRRPVEVAEGQFHEALLNLSPEGDTPLWLVCPYDADALDPAVIEEAFRSHPFHTDSDAGSPVPGARVRGPDARPGLLLRAAARTCRSSDTAGQRLRRRPGTAVAASGRCGWTARLELGATGDGGRCGDQHGCGRGQRPAVAGAGHARLPDR